MKHSDDVSPWPAAILEAMERGASGAEPLEDVDLQAVVQVQVSRSEHPRGWLWLRRLLRLPLTRVELHAELRREDAPTLHLGASCPRAEADLISALPSLAGAPQRRLSWDRLMATLAAARDAGAAWASYQPSALEGGAHGLTERGEGGAVDDASGSLVPQIDLSFLAAPLLYYAMSRLGCVFAVVSVAGARVGGVEAGMALGLVALTALGLFARSRIKGEAEAHERWLNAVVVGGTEASVAWLLHASSGGLGPELGVSSASFIAIFINMLVLYMLMSIGEALREKETLKERFYWLLGRSVGGVIMGPLIALPATCIPWLLLILLYIPADVSLLAAVGLTGLAFGGLMMTRAAPEMYSILEEGWAFEET